MLRQAAAQIIPVLDKKYKVGYGVWFIGSWRQPGGRSVTESTQPSSLEDRLNELFGSLRGNIALMLSATNNAALGLEMVDRRLQTHIQLITHTCSKFVAMAIPEPTRGAVSSRLNNLAEEIERQPSLARFEISRDMLVHVLRDTAQIVHG